MESVKVTRSGRRLSREEWIRRGLSAIAKEGGRRMSIDDLVAALGVTKGSFYWHFEGRDDFVREVLDHWAETYTYGLGPRLEESGLTGPADQLRLLMTILCDEGHARYDIAVRAWSTQEEAVAKCLRKVDRFRLKLVGGIFARLGFTGDEWEARTRIFVAYHSLEFALAVPLPKARRRELIETCLAFFTRR